MIKKEKQTVNVKTEDYSKRARYGSTITGTSSAVSTKQIKSHNRLIKRISDDDWKAFDQLKKEHNKHFPTSKMTFRKFFKLMNTYSPIVQSIMQLNPDDSPIQRLGVNTALVHAKMWTRNIGNNVARIKAEHDIRELKGKFKDKAAIIIGAGGSLKDNASGTDHLQVIKEYADKFDGVIIVVDRMLEECLQLGIGDYFTVVDGSEVIYNKFFDNETVRNYKGKMKGFMATCTNEKVVNAWNGQIYFFVASIPPEILPNATPLMSDFTDTSDINAGGNCGALAWNLCMWMGIRETAMIGMDYSYKVTEDVENTSNFQQFATQLGVEAARKQAFHEGYNKFFKTPYLIDDIYSAFRDVFFIWTRGYKDHGYNTYNCTEGGSLDDSSITQMYLIDFLKSHLKK